MMDIINEVRDDHQMLYDKRDVIRLLERQREQYKTLDVHTDNSEVIANLMGDKEQMLDGILANLEDIRDTCYPDCIDKLFRLITYLEFIKGK